MDALAAWRRLGHGAAGRWLYARLVCWRAPYFASIAPRIDELAPGRCVARIAHRRRVTNHLGTVHAIALCNLAELVAGLATDVTVPRTMRWIPKGMRVAYLAKAAGTMRATATVPTIDPARGAHEIDVEVAIEDPSGTRTVEASITMWISPRRPSVAS